MSVSPCSACLGGVAFFQHGAFFLPPRRGAFFQATPSMFRALSLCGATVIFCRVLIKAAALFDFEMRGLVLDKAWLSFYIKPADGYQLPKIMQWLKQTFSVWFNITTWRTGGDAFFQRGAFFAAAPRRGLQATPPAQLVVPVSGAVLGRR
jgi:hypothetical protein